jgi:hypothetical protein
VSFLRKIPGLEHSQQGQVSKLRTDLVHRRLVQAVVSSHGPLVGRTIADAKFLDVYGAAVLSGEGAECAVVLCCVALCCVRRSAPPPQRANTKLDSFCFCAPASL